MGSRADILAGVVVGDTLAKIVRVADIMPLRRRYASQEVDVVHIALLR